MLRKLLTTLILLASPLWSFGQSPDRNVQTENELAATLCAQGGESAREQLLASNPRLVNKDLWEALNTRAATAYYASSHEKSLASYNIALEVAAYLKESETRGDNLLQHRSHLLRIKSNTKSDRRL